MDTNISISLFRVSSDSEYLDMIFDCGANYHFTSLMLEVRYSEDNRVGKRDTFDLSLVLFNNNSEDPNNTLNKRHWTVRLPLKRIGFGKQKPAIYIATFKVESAQHTVCSYKVRTNTSSIVAAKFPKLSNWINGYTYVATDDSEGNVQYLLEVLEDKAIQQVKLCYYDAEEGTIELSDPITKIDDNKFSVDVEYTSTDTQTSALFYVKFADGTESLTDYLLYDLVDYDNNKVINPYSCIDVTGDLVFTDTAICSDINNIYVNLIDGILNTGDRCTQISDDVIRNYIILYAHQLALQMGELDDALLYFNMINSNFDRCGNFKRSGKHIKSCNCGKR